MRKNSFGQRLGKDIIKYKYIYIMLIPVLAYYILFKYVPMYGAQIAFKDFRPRLGILKSPWVGFEHYMLFFKSVFFVRVFRNTILLSFYTIIFGFPAPVILALLLNEMRSEPYKRVVQTVSYIPHFISMVVICGMIRNFTASGGLINEIIAFFGGTRKTMLLDPSLFRSIYVISEIWQSAGWGTIIYLAAISGIDVQLYDAATIDGAGRFRKILHVTLPGISSTIIILFILRLGRVMNVGFEKIILLYNENIYETSDVISSFVYRKGLLEMNFSFSSAVGLLNSAINFVFIIAANTLSRKISDTSLW
jgi:putative aldouronate transport system permease protein